MAPATIFPDSIPPVANHAPTWLMPFTAAFAGTSSLMASYARYAWPIPRALFSLSGSRLGISYYRDRRMYAAASDRVLNRPRTTDVPVSITKYATPLKEILIYFPNSPCSPLAVHGPQAD